jgi:hypothetical protein
MAITRADTTLRWDGNSLFLYERRPGFVETMRIARGGLEPTNFATFTAGRDATWLTWVAAVRDSTSARSELRAHRVDRTKANPTPLVIDSAAGRFSVTSDSVTGQLLWVVEHRSKTDSRLRIVATSDTGVTRLMDIPNPFVGGFQAAFTSPGRLLVVGYHVGPEGIRADWPSLVVTVAVSCPGTVSAPRRRS